MVKILEHYDKPDSVCSFWRGRGPFSELERSGNVTCTLSDWYEGWDDIGRNNLAYFQRPINAECLRHVLYCHDMGLKTWIDLDDWLDIPRQHPVYDKYMEIYDGLSMKKMLYISDVITVTTHKLYMLLKERYPRISDKIFIVQNAINDRLYRFVSMSDKKIIVWRGGDNHIHDILHCVGGIRKFLINRPDWKFYTIGYDTHYFDDIENHYYLGNVDDVHKYFALIRRINPSILISPLIDNDFNRAKSNIAWIEATIAGAVCISPHFADVSCAIRYWEDIYSVLYETAGDHNIRKTVYEKSVDMIKNNYMLSEVNGKRMDIIKKLLK